MEKAFSMRSYSDLLVDLGRAHFDGKDVGCGPQVTFELLARQLAAQPRGADIAPERRQNAGNGVGR